jgi:hypothetical protein
MSGASRAAGTTVSVRPMPIPGLPPPFGGWRALLRYMAINFVITFIACAIAAGGMGEQSIDQVIELYKLMVISTMEGDMSVVIGLAITASVIVGVQAIFIAPIFRPLEAGVRPRSLLKSAVVAGLAAGLLTAAVVWAAVELAVGEQELVELLDDGEPWAFFGLPAIVLLPTWILWARFFYRLSQPGDPVGLDRMMLPLIAHSAVGMLLLVPIDAIVRRKKDCICATGSYLGVVLGIMATLWLLGPFAMLALSRRRRMALRRRACLACGHERPPTPSEVCQECGRGWTKRRRRRRGQES